MFGKVPPFCESKTAVVALVRLARDVLLLVFPERLFRCETFVALGTPERLVQELVGVAPRTCLVRSQLVAAICYVAAVLTSEKLWRGLVGYVGNTMPRCFLLMCLVKASFPHFVRIVQLQR